MNNIKQEALEQESLYFLQENGLLAICKHCNYIGIWSIYCSNCNKNRFE